MSGAFFKKLLRILTFAVSGILLIATLISVIFYFNKDKIYRELLQIADDIQAGEIVFGDLALSLFSHFPHVSIRLENVLYYEHRQSERETGELPVCNIGQIYLAFDVVHLIQGKIDVEEITLKDGEVHLVSYPDSTLNLLNALGLSSARKDAETDTLVPGTRIDLQLKEVTLENLLLNYDNQISGEKVELRINQLKNELTFSERQLACKMAPDIVLLGIENNHRRFLENTDIFMDIDLHLDTQTLAGQISAGRLVVEGVTLEVEGRFNLKEEGYVDLKVGTSVGDLSLLSLIFTDEAIRSNIDNLKTGKLYLNGVISGKTRHHTPFVEFSFGAQDIHFQPPGGMEPLQGLGFSGYFTTGRAPDFSEAEIKLEGLQARLPGGGLKGSFYIRNLNQPQVRLNCQTRADITGFDKIFKLGGIERLEGSIAVEADINGEINFQDKEILKDAGNATITFEKVAFRFPQSNQMIEELSGGLQKTADSLYLRDIYLKSGESDLKINGDITNLLYHLFGRESGITANLKIETGQVNLAEALAFDTSLAHRFDEEISDLNADLSLMTSTTGLIKYSLLPHGSIDINALSGKFKNYADIKNLSGKILVEEDTIHIQQLQGIAGESDFSLAADLVNYRGLVDKGIPADMELALELTFGSLNVADLFTYRDKVYFFKALKDEIFSDLHLRANFSISNQELFGDKPLPDFSLQIRKLRGKMSSYHLPFRDFVVDMSGKEDDLIFHRLQGTVGEQMITVNGTIENVASPAMDTADSLRIRANLQAKDLNINTFIPPDSPKESEGQEILFRFPPICLSADIASLKFNQMEVTNFRGNFTTTGSGKIILNQDDQSYRPPVFNISATVEADTIESPGVSIPRFYLVIKGKNGVIDLRPNVEGFFGSRGQGSIVLDFSSPSNHYSMQYTVEDFRIEKLLSRFTENRVMAGTMDFYTDISMSGDNLDEMIKSLSGECSLTGEDLIIYNIDIDRLLTKFKKSQQFNLVDISAYFVAGPAGALVTKASDFATLLTIDPGEQSHLPQIISQWEVRSGIAETKDVAFITDKSRIALKGGLDLVNQEYRNLTVAVVNQKGCVLISQSVDGPFNNPQFGEIDMVGKLLAPVINVFTLITGKECEPFYSGSLKHP